MPIVLTENEDTESGIYYADNTGISYQFPKMYRKRVRPGERFVYYRGRKKKSGGRHPQVYFGAGIVGDVRDDEDHSGRLICEILDYRPFAVPVPFKTGLKAYLETGGDRRGYFQQGVRGISESDMERILSLAKLEVLSPAAETEMTDTKRTRAYASSELIAKIERFAIDAAITFLRAQKPSATIEEQPRNNPGFDILVTDRSETVYVEVKGTSRQFPQFLITEGEMQFAARNSDRFRLLVVHSITLSSGSHAIFDHAGAITSELFSLKPLQWFCAFRDK